MAAMPEPTDDADLSFDTLAVHAGAEPDELTGAVAPPIYQTSTYEQDGVGKPRRGYEYARSQNPTRERLERAIATLEGGRHGFAFASGSAATAAIAELAGPGDEIVVGDDVYGGTYRYLEKVRKGAGVTTSYVDLAAGPDVLWEALSERTRLVWFETPTNPLLKTVDIAAIAATVERRAAEGGRRPLIVVDNTFASPAIQRPAHAGRGHRVPLRDEVPRRPLRHDPRAGRDLGRRGRGATALPAERDGRGARAAGLLPRAARPADAAPARGAPSVERRGRGRRSCASDRTWQTVLYPGIGGMVSFLPAPGSGRTAADRAIAIAEGTRLFTLAESLGGVESLIEIPAAMTHMSVAGSPLEVDPALVRLSVGIEGVDDLIADLAKALDGA